MVEGEIDRARLEEKREWMCLVVVELLLECLRRCVVEEL